MSRGLGGIIPPSHGASRVVGAFERQSLSGCVLLQYMLLSDCLEDNAFYCTRGWVEYAPCRGWFDQITFFSRIVQS